MSLVRNIEITPLAIGRSAGDRSISTQPSIATKQAPVEKVNLPLGDEFVILQVAPDTIADIFVHHSKTDRLTVVRGFLVLVILLDGHYRYIPLSGDDLRTVQIPPGVPHGVINLGPEPCTVVNSLLRHGPTAPSDYQSLGQPIPYDLDIVRALFAEFSYS